MIYRFLFCITLLLTQFGVGSTFAQDKGYDVKSYNLQLKIDKQKNYLEGSVVMHIVTTSELDSVLQHVKALVIDSVFVNGAKASYQITDTTSGTYKVIGFPKLYRNVDAIVNTYYHGNPTNEGGANPWGGVTNNGKMMFAMGVGFAVPYVSCTRHWMPCYDLPDDKADSVTMTFVTADSDIVASNGIRTSDVIQADLRTTTWKVIHPIASYLLTFAVGPFVEQTITTPSSITIDGFSYTGDSVKLSNVLYKRVIQAVTFYDSLYGKYPFEKVGYVVAPIGSMEHQTMITLVDLALDTNSTTPEHELAHMWWGDWVTCKDFNDPWLNEGFATYSESLILERFTNKAAYWTKQRSNIVGAINTGSKIPMYGAPYLTSPRNNYPYGVIYQKGAAVLGMLRYVLGDSLFFESLRQYGKTHSYSTATSFEMQTDFERVSGQDLHWFFKQWVFGIWYPQISVSWSRNGGNVNVQFDQTQDHSKYQYFRTPITVEARTTSGQHERSIALMDSLASTSYSLHFSFAPDTIVIDPDGVLIKKIVGAVKLGVGSPLDVPKVSSRLKLVFSPNPSKQQQVMISIDGMNVNTNEQIATLHLYDTNGKQVGSYKLERPKINTITNMTEYSLNTGSLSSGTYFATLVLNGTEVGDGQFVVTK